MLFVYILIPFYFHSQFRNALIRHYSQFSASRTLICNIDSRYCQSRGESICPASSSYTNAEHSYARGAVWSACHKRWLSNGYVYKYLHLYLEIVPYFAGDVIPHAEENSFPVNYERIFHIIGWDDTSVPTIIGAWTPVCGNELNIASKAHWIKVRFSGIE